MTSAIETIGLAKTYGGIAALAPLDLNVKLGTCFGLLGPNGAGKSTLVKTLLGIVHASAGSAKLLGVDFKNAESRRSVGYLPEGHRFPRYLTGRQVCSYFGKLAGLGGATLKTEIDEKLAVVGMSEWANTKITKYSKGMMQRVGLAQAMLGNPKLVFLDEPTDGVDPVGRQQMREVVRGYAGEGRTVFLNSHLLSEVELICDEIAILAKGKMIRSGTVTEIKASMTRGTAAHLRFQTGPLDAEAKSKLAPFSPEYQPDGWFAVILPHRDDTVKVIDVLRARGVPVFAVIPSQGNLEDAFIELITGADAASVGGAHS